MTTAETLAPFIDGKFVACDGPMSEFYNPSTGTVIGTALLGNESHVDAAVAAASDAFRSWRRTTPAERSHTLLKLADLVEAHAAEFVQIDSANAGKPISALTQWEFPQIVDVIHFFAGAARVLEGGPASAEYLPDRTSFMRREPLGVVGSIAPWNDPLWMAVVKVVPAIAAGNTVVLKPALQTPASALRLAELAAEILPPGVLNVVTGGVEVGMAISAHPAVRMISLTGSVDTGRAVAEAAARTLKRTHLELGGKAPVVVFNDADLDLVAQVAGQMAYFNAGESCAAASRFLVQRESMEELTGLLCAFADALVLGDTALQETTFGPLITGQHRENVEGFLERRGKHARVVRGGNRPDSPGFFLEPTIVTGVHQDDELVQREVFGPVVTIQPFDREDEAVALANGTQYGLTGSVWTRDLARGLRMTRELEAGTVWINTHCELTCETPFGGYRRSGLGKEFGVQAINDYSQLKHVMANIQPE